MAVHVVGEPARADRHGYAPLLGVVGEGDDLVTVGVAERRAPVFVLEHVHGVVGAAPHAHRKGYAASALLVAEGVVLEPSAPAPVLVAVVEDAADDLSLVADRVPALVQLAVAADHHLVGPHGRARRPGRRRERRIPEAVVRSELVDGELDPRELRAAEAPWLVRGGRRG